MAMHRSQYFLFVCVYFASTFNVTIFAQDNIASDVGYAKGYLSDCPGSEKPLKIPRSLMSKLFIVVYRSQAGLPYRRNYAYPQAVNGIANDPMMQAVNAIANDPTIDWSKRTVLFISGFLDSTVFPFAGLVGETYSRLGYNVLLLDTARFTTYPYPVASRISRAVGARVAKILSGLTYHGLNPKTLEILGLSLGGQTASSIGKNFQTLTTTKISRITGLDPAGPCFRNLPPSSRLDAGDADFVDVIHTNIDGLGSASAWGHVDFYVNGGEYQPPAILAIPCLLLCSHVRSLFVWLAALENPDLFIGLKCNSIQDARNSDCYNRTPLEINTVGLLTMKNATGIFYLNTSNQSPYGLGKNGLTKQSNMFDRDIAKFNTGFDISW